MTKTLVTLPESTIYVLVRDREEETRLQVMLLVGIVVVWGTTYRITSFSYGGVVNSTLQYRITLQQVMK